MKGSYQIFRRGCFGKCVIKLPSFTEKKPLDPNIFLQSDKHTRSKVTYHHEEKTKQNSSIKSKTPYCGKAMCPVKKTKGNKTKIICLLFCADVCLVDEPPCQWFEAAKLTGDRCVHWQTIGLNYTSQHHEKLTNHCNTHWLRWFEIKALLCLKNANLIALRRTCANIGCYNHLFL